MNLKKRIERLKNILLAGGPSSYYYHSILLECFEELLRRLEKIEISLGKDWEGNEEAYKEQK